MTENRKSEDSPSENINFDMYRPIVVLSLSLHCHSQQASYEPTANDSEVVSKSKELIPE